MRRQWFNFDYHVGLLCEPASSDKLHDELAVIVSQAVADHTGESLTMRDCRTGQFRGSVTPRKKRKKKNDWIAKVIGIEVIEEEVDEDERDNEDCEQRKK